MVHRRENLKQCLLMRLIKSLEITLKKFQNNGRNNRTINRYYNRQKLEKQYLSLLSPIFNIKWTLTLNRFKRVIPRHKLVFIMQHTFSFFFLIFQYFLSKAIDYCYFSISVVIQVQSFELMTQS